MQPLAFLLQDLYTFLAYIQAHPIRIIGARFLPTTHLATLNQLLAVRAPLSLQPLKNSRGQWQRGAVTKLRERDLPRLCWLHALAEFAQLIQHQQREILLTPRAAQWLESNPAAQVALLFDAAFPQHPTDAHFETWRAFRLPGHHLTSPGQLLMPLLEIISVADASTLKLATLLKLIPLQTFPDDPPEFAPTEILRQTLNLLQSLGRVTWQTRAVIQIHPTPALTVQPQSYSTFLWSKPRGDTLPNLIADERAEPRALFLLSKYAKHITTLVTARSLRRLYQLDSQIIQRALDQGAALADITTFLENITRDDLPPRVHAWLAEIGEKYGGLTLRRAVLLESDDAAKLNALVSSKTIRSCIRRPLSPRVVVVRPDRVAPLVRRLKHRGYIPRVEFNIGESPVSSLQSPVPNPQSPASTLYFAVQLARHLAARHLITYHIPASVLQTLSESLTPETKAQLDTQIQDLLESSPLFTPPPKNRAATISAAARLDAPSAELVSKHLAQIQNALAAQTALTITYYSPYRDETTQRVVEPHFLQTRHHTHYLIGYCHLDRAERTFRVDRIQQIADSASQRAER